MNSIIEDESTIPGFDDVVDLIKKERLSQLAKWGDQNNKDLFWLAILTEELGEVSKAIIEGEDVNKIKAEIIQVAAVSVAWLEKLINQS